MAENERRYCMYCDDLRANIPCEACGHRTHSMMPEQDSYLAASKAAFKAVLAQQGSET